MRAARALGKWGRRWVYTAAQFGLSALAWLYMLALAASLLFMVLIVGLLTARAILPLGRVLANWSLLASQWVRRRGETAAIPATPAEGGLAVVVTALLRSGATWRAVAYLLVNALLLPAHLVALGLFPLAGLWARADSWFSVRMLGPVSAAPRLPDAARAPAAAAHLPLQAGFGLIGMAERAAALGGRLTAVPTDDGGFAVRAVLPLPSGRGPPASAPGRPAVSAPDAPDAPGAEAQASSAGLAAGRAGSSAPAGMGDQ